MTGAFGIIAWLIGVSGGLFVLIGLPVLAAGGMGSGRGARSGETRLGGPRGGGPGRGGVRGADWAVLAETAEPGRRVGGASATW